MSASWFSISKSTLINILTKLQTVFDTKADSSHTHTKSEITDFAHDHPLSIEAASTATSAINLDPNAIYKLTAGGKTFIFKTPADSDHYAWADITGKPSSYPPSAHTHTVSQITDFPTIPTVNNGALTIKRNGTSLGTFTANQSGNSNIDISVPTTLDNVSDGSTRKLANYIAKAGGTMTGTLTTRSDNNNGDIIPTTEGTGSIGLASKRYASVYTNSLKLGKLGNSLGSISMYNTTSGAEVYLSESILI